MNLTRATALIDTLEADPRKVPAYFMFLENVIAWLMDETFASTDADEKARLAAMEMHARLQLIALAYNLGNFLRRLALPRSVKHWSLTMLREKLIKIGAKVVTHSGYVIFQMAEVAVPRELFAAILDRIQRFGVPPPLVQRG